MTSAIAAAKNQLPLPTLMERLGLGAHAKSSARCPFHDDQRNSFSVWRSSRGLWFWKCHAGCGEGDEISLLEKHRAISNRDAIKLFIELAGVGSSATKSGPPSAVNWRACVEALTDEHLERLSEWRGFSGEFCSWLKENGLVGLFENCIAFPVNEPGNDSVRAIHYRLKDGSWRYHPTGVKIHPLIVGDLAAGDTFYGFKSQWDAFAFMDRSGERSGIVISRGAANGALLANLISQKSTIYLWPQNDAAGDKWTKAIRANTNATLKLAKIPAPHKDLNDWTQADATVDGLFHAMLAAQTVGAAHDQIELDPAVADGGSESELEGRIPDFPVDCLPPLLKNQARAISKLCGVPVAMSGPMVLGTASIAIGRGLRVRSLPGRRTQANLFVLISKTSGSGGSLTFKHATAPLVGKQKTLRREFEENEKPRIDAEYTDVLAQIDEQKRRLRSPKPGEREQIVTKLTELNETRAKLELKRKGKLLYVTDITPEKLAELLAEHGETLGHIDSDAGDALGLIVGTRYGGSDKHTSDSIWLKSYSGEPVVIFRKNSEPQHLTAPCMAVLFVATPGKAQELFKDSRMTNGGLLPRFLACDPRARPVPITAEDIPTTYKLPTDVSQPYESAIFAVLTRYRSVTKEEEITEIDMTPAARELLKDDWNRFCTGCDDNEDHPFEARHTENAIRIALVLHTFRCISQLQESEGTFHSELHAHETPLDEQSMGNAIRVRDWFNQHQERLRGPQRAAVEDEAWRKAQVMMRERPARGITGRDLYNSRKVCRNSLEAEGLLNKWKSEGRIVSFEWKTTEKGGRPTVGYRLAPLGRN